MAAWEEGSKIVQRAKLFSAGAFFLLILLSLFAAANGDLFNAAYFGALSLVSLALFFYVRRIFRVRQPGSYSLRRSTQRR